MPRRHSLLLEVLVPVLLTFVWLVTLGVLGFWLFIEFLSYFGTSETGPELDPHTLTMPVALLVLVLAPAIGLVKMAFDRRWELVAWFAVLLVSSGFIANWFLSRR
ncbi:MAG: hypothetical protein ABIQ18_36025 [Umezawaea sp.]